MSSPYCTWGLCQSNQYCCADNFCCDESDFNILFLTLIIFGTIVVTATCCTCFYCNPRRMYTPIFNKYFQISYTLMSNEQQQQHQKTKANTAINQGSTVVEGCIV